MTRDDSESIELLDAYLAELHSGKPPDRARWIAEHPAFAAHFECLDRLDQLAVPSDANGTIADTSNSFFDEPSAVGEFVADGKYEILGEIGRGGMGVVYRARQVGLDRIVALKMVLAGSLASPEQLSRFQDEAKVAARVQHPHVVQVIEAGWDRGRPFLVMQHVEGCSLAERLRSGSMEIESALRCAAAIARAVADLHVHGIVHRDLKPSNILLDARDQPYVTDFGLAKLIEGESGVTQTGAILGTPQYMAPEQALGRGGEVGPAADVYSLGAILYELLTGRPPFRAATPLDTILAVLESEPTLPRQVNSKIPRVLEQVCLQCLEKEPSRRWPSAESLAEVLEGYLKGDLVSVRKAGPLTRFRRWGRREPALVSRLVAFTIFAGIVTFNHFADPSLRTMTLPVLGLLAIWALVSWLCQKGLRCPGWGHRAGYVWSAADITFLTAIQFVTQSGISPVIIGYPFVIASAGMWTLRRMVWVTTILAMLGYAGLMIYDLNTSSHPQPAHRHLIFLISLLVLGFLMAYQVERVRALSRYYEKNPKV